MPTQEIVWVVSILGGMVAFITFWMHLSAKITNAQATASGAKAVSDVLATRMSQVVDKVAEDRVAVEVKIAIVKTLGEANTISINATEARIDKSLQEIKESMQYFHQRMDQLLSK